MGNVIPMLTIQEVVKTMDEETLRLAASHPFALDDGSFHPSFHKNLYNAAVAELEKSEAV